MLAKVKSYLPAFIAGITVLGSGQLVAAQTTTLDSEEVGGILDTMISDIVTIFTDNVPTVIAFAVGFAVLSLLIAWVFRKFRL